MWWKKSGRGQDVAWDIGTSKVRLVRLGRQRVTETSSIVFSAGQKIFPVREGVVVHEKMAAVLLEKMLKLGSWSWGAFTTKRPRTLLFAPSDATLEERHLLVSAARLAGAGAITLIPEPMAAAIGAGLPVESPHAQMIVDVGAGVIDGAVIREGRVLYSFAQRFSGLHAEQILQRFVLENRGIALNERQVGDLLHRLCTPSEDRQVTGFGTHRDSLQMVSFAIDRQVIQGITGEMVQRTGEVIDRGLSAIPAKIACEVLEGSVVLTGGGSLLPGLRQSLEKQIGYSFACAQNPSHSVIEGARKILNFGALYRVWSESAEDVSFQGWGR